MISGVIKSNEISLKVGSEEKKVEGSFYYGWMPANGELQRDLEGGLSEGWTNGNVLIFLDFKIDINEKDVSKIDTHWFYNSFLFANNAKQFKDSDWEGFLDVVLVPEDVIKLPKWELNENYLVVKIVLAKRTAGISDFDVLLETFGDSFGDSFR